MSSYFGKTKVQKMAEAIEKIEEVKKAIKDYVQYPKEWESETGKLESALDIIKNL